MSTTRINLQCVCGHAGVLFKRIQLGLEFNELRYFLGGGEEQDDLAQMICPACGKVGQVSIDER